MAKVSAGDIRNGVTIEVDGKVCQVIDFMHVKPGKGAAFVRVKMKNIIDYSKTNLYTFSEKRFNNVDLPLPDFPKRKTKPFSGNLIDTSFKAVTDTPFLVL